MRRKRQSPPLATEDLEILRARVDLVDLMQALHIGLRRVGRGWVAQCPFHSDAEYTLVLRRAAGTWACRTCRTEGDALSFVQLHEKRTLEEAVVRLGELAGQALDKTEPPPSARELLERVVTIYANGLRESTAAQQYLVARGLDSPELWRSFRLGVASGQLTRMVSEKHGDAIRQGLIDLGVLDETGQERFAGCLVVPLSHPDHGVVGLYGRRLAAGGDGPMHRYLPGRRRGVFNGEALQLSERTVLAKSVMDGLSIWMAGQGAVTCLLDPGELPPDLGELLARYGTRELLLALDDEPARVLGRQLEHRGIRCCRVVLPRGHDANSLLTDEGPLALQEALRDVREVFVSAEAEGAPVQALRQETGDGFTLTFDRTRYQVTPRPPFNGRMRITLRVNHEARRFYDNLDLFSHRARATTINQVARLGVVRAEAERHLNVLTEETEKWIAAVPADDIAETPKKAPELQAHEREEALEFLRRADLLQAVLEDMDALGYVGEEVAKLLAYLIGVSRKLERPLSGIVMSQSGAGKSALAELIESLTPPENVVLYSRLSAQALGYMPRDFLRRKLIILEERVGAEAADYQIRVLQSRQRLSQGVVMKDSTTGKMQTRHIEVEGPIAYLETTTSARINHENATRCFEIHLDESEAQTRRIHQRQREMRMDGWARRPLADPIRQRHHNAQRLLEPARVLIPYGPLLSFPSRWLRTRRDHERFLSLIDAVTFLHQYQRESGELQENGHTFRFVRATVEDYRRAYELAQEVLGATLHELSRDARELLDAAQTMLLQRDASDAVFTRRDIRQYISWLDHRTRSALHELVQMEYLEVIGGSQGRTFAYQLAAPAGAETGLRELTTPDQLQAMLEGAS